MEQEKFPSVATKVMNWLSDHPESRLADIRRGIGLNYDPSGVCDDLVRRERITKNIDKLYSIRS